MLERIENRLVADTWGELGLDVPKSKLDSGADVKIRHCPECKAQGKKSNDFSVSIIPGHGKGHCHKCGTVYIIRSEAVKPKQEREWTPPSRKNLTALSESSLKFFTDRRLNQDAVNHFKICEGSGGWVAFPYFYNGELVNIKYRSVAEKKFMQSPGGKHVVFNYDNAKAFNAVLIAEGECCAMSWYCAGVEFATSVDCGAPNPKDNVEKKLECITNSFDLFENADVIYIAVDNDANGKALEQELVRRFQIEKVRIVSYAPHKDANEYLLYEGGDALKQLLGKAKELKMEGVFTLEDVESELNAMYENGLPKGTTTHMPSIDRCWKWRQGEVTVVTGYNNEGKSTLYDIYLPILKSWFEDWGFGLYVPENFPAEEFFEEVIHAVVGKTTDKDYPQHRMNRSEFENAKTFVKKYFHLVFPEKKRSVEELFQRFDYLVRRHGIRAIIIDPYNNIEHTYNIGETIDQYVTRFMLMLKVFARTRRLSIILVAHQNPPKTKEKNGKDYPMPDIYTIKNGGGFGDLTDNVVVVWRPMRHSEPEDPTVTFSSQKIKKKKLVAKTGVVDILYDWKSNRYLDPGLNNRSPLEAKEKVVENAAETLPF